jgi:hypothetical protein
MLEIAEPNSRHGISRYHKFLIAGFAAVWVWAAINLSARLAFLGAVVAMSIAMLIRRALDGDIPQGLRRSLILDRDDRPLGEVEFRRLWQNRATGTGSDVHPDGRDDSGS